MISIKKASLSDEKAISDIMLLAFSNDPIARWQYSGINQYINYFPKFIKAFCERAFEKETAYYIDEFKGAALWLPPEVHPDEDILNSVIEETVAEEVRNDFSTLFEQLEKYHPSEPHWYLPLIGIDPYYANCGNGSKLLAETIILCNINSAPAYLESTNPKNIKFYEKHGFKLLGSVKVGKSPEMYPMLRNPII